MEINLDSFDFNHITIKDNNGEVLEFNLIEELKINEFNVVSEFLQQPAKYVYWSSILEKVKMYRESAELQAETYKSSIYESSRLGLVEVGINKPTKEQVNAEIMGDEHYIKLLESLNTYKYLVGQLTYVVKAFEQRRDMLIQYGADLRKTKEYERSISMPNNLPQQY